MPEIQLDACIKCMKCVNDCPSQAIEIETGKINDSCIHCGHCVAICPVACVLPDSGDVISLPPSGITAESFSPFIAGIRSCRHYKKKSVPKAMLDDLIYQMKHYSSASNRRPVEITVIQSPEKVQRLNDATTKAMLKTLSMITNPFIKIGVKLLMPSMDVSSLLAYKEKFIARQVTNNSQICHNAPLVMLFHAPKSKFGMAKEDALIWATNTVNYAASMGLGSCHIGFIVKAMERSKSLRSEFCIPNGHVVHAALVIGYPNVHYIHETSRQPPVFKVI